MPEVGDEEGRIVRRERMMIEELVLEKRRGRKGDKEKRRNWGRGFSKDIERRRDLRRR